VFSWWEQAEGLGFGVAVRRQADRRLREPRKNKRPLTSDLPQERKFDLVLAGGHELFPSCHRDYVIF
jgi:hypothetical protein